MPKSNEGGETVRMMGYAAFKTTDLMQAWLHRKGDVDELQWWTIWEMLRDRHRLERGLTVRG